MTYGAYFIVAGIIAAFVFTVAFTAALSKDRINRPEDVVCIVLASVAAGLVWPFTAAIALLYEAFIVGGEW